ncbi:hypothetical protein F4775DRAFT_592837 [Biscogniauxia sp. FL1348]|nr:hypothetical protein F4775DRAFT_592837 [Biscogniauxia sp. FL1348]
MTEETADVAMTGTAPDPSPKAKKAHELATCTIKVPPYAYAHLEVFSNEGPESIELDALQVRSYCTAALRQFLGATGMAVPLDILKVSGHSCWLRLPRDDLGGFSAAITAWQGTMQDGSTLVMGSKGKETAFVMKESWHGSKAPNF